MEVSNSHIHCNQISAISNAGAIRFMTYTSTMTAALFIVFLGKLAAWAGQKIFLMRRSPQGARCRRRSTSGWRSIATGLELFYLPRYSPERNPDEYLNNDRKGGVNKTGLPHSQADLRSRIQAFTHRLWHLPEHVPELLPTSQRPVCRRPLSCPM